MNSSSPAQDHQVQLAEAARVFRGLGVTTAQAISALQALGSALTTIPKAARIPLYGYLADTHIEEETPCNRWPKRRPSPSPCFHVTRRWRPMVCDRLARVAPAPVRGWVASGGT